ncbi:hypothetical protein HAHE_22330 [Haloferula helveola]|uniref:Sulfotransferase domain-containing protein n=1 Tax=Haloferula helveola TaxID=490095 RepID=A0ABM7RGD3_9BACT|nr:hypothetical protein HAHE_22330 [Haloferula helveola]
MRSPVIQFGPPRTGSTVVWNALRAILPGQDIPKRHDLSFLHLSPFCRSRIVCTVRNPLDIIVSMLGVSELEPTPEAVTGKILELEHHGLGNVLSIRQRPGTLFLRYEDFYGNFDYLFDELTRFLKVEIGDEERNRFNEEFHVESVRKRAENLGDFGNFDPGDHIHGRHISRYSGRPGYHSEVLDRDSAIRIRERFASFMAAFDYLPDAGRSE